MAGIPLAQGIAVTGSVNQRGEIRPVGGVNEAVRRALIQNVERLKAMHHAPSLAVARTGKDDRP